MKLIRTAATILTSVLFLLISCQDDAKKDREIEILESDEIETDVGNQERLEGEEGENNTLYNELQEDPDLSTFAEGFEATGMNEEIRQNEGPYTVFAPSNSAYEALSEEDRQRLQDPNRREENRELWRYYMANGAMTADYFSKKLEVGRGPWNITTLQGEDIVAWYEGDNLMLEDARGNRSVVERTIDTGRDGVVHVTSQVLTPSGGFTGSETEVNSEVKTDKQF